MQRLVEYRFWGRWGDYLIVLRVASKFHVVAFSGSFGTPRGPKWTWLPLVRHHLNGPHQRRCWSAHFLNLEIVWVTA